MLDYCIDKVKTYLSIDDLLQCGDFFEAKEKASLAKIEFFKKHPDAYKLTMETFRTPPSELKEEIAEMYGEQFAIRDRLWRELFAKVPLREGVDREEAFELIMLANEHFERKFLSEIAEDREFDEDYNRRLLDERNRFLNMIRFGIER